MSTSNDERWHSATASCGPYDVASPAYGWIWNGSISFPVGTVAGNISRAACYW